MAKAQRFNNKLVRCGDAATVACTCAAAPCTTICNLETASDVDVYFEDITDCGLGGCFAKTHTKTFLCTWDGAFWSHTTPANDWVGVRCFGGNMQVYYLLSTAALCFSSVNVADCLPQTVKNQNWCLPDEPEGQSGFAIVSVH